jgi:GNAT superfamily N-acetyltransferase
VSVNRVLIRSAKLEDVDVLCRLYGEFHEFHVKGVPDRLVGLGEPERHDSPKLRSDIAKVINNQNSDILLSLVDNQVVGFAEVYLRKDEPDPARVAYRYGHLQSLLVTEEFRRQGVGEKLLEAAENWAKAIGATEMRLDIWEFPEGPLRFYEKTCYRTLQRKLVRRL